MTEENARAYLTLPDMRLNVFRALPKDEQKKEVARVLVEIHEARKHLDETGVWDLKDFKKRLKKGEAVTVWRAK